MPESDFSVILTTAGSREEAGRLADLLVSQRLAACVQIMGIDSTYRWQGQVVKEPEFLLLVKTRAALYPQVEAAIRAGHSYDVPEIMQLPITQGLESYLGWIGENTAI
jgi:periplasmic divalent cation tolerance protein